MRRIGFTLIEIMAVISIMGLLCAAVMLSLMHTAGKHRFEALCQQLERTDELVRSAARQSGHENQLIYDLDDGRLSWQATQNGVVTPMLSFDRNALQALRTEDQQNLSGQVLIKFSTSGQSPSYALCMSEGGRRHWMIFAGLSGQIEWTDNEEQVDTIFKSVAADDLFAPSRR